MKKLGRPVIDMAGKKFGRLRVIEQAESSGGHARWKCECDCGKEVVVNGHFLRAGYTTSCGCYSAEQIAVRSTKHGKTETRLYKIWHGMKKRCYDKKDHGYPRYGGRGIVIFPEWRENFESFYQWAMQNGYADHLTIDRINNDGNYAPENCRWVDIKTQSNNKSCNRVITTHGETHTVSQWANLLNARPTAIFARLDRGWPEEKAVTVPVKKYRRRKNESINTSKTRIDKTEPRYQAGEQAGCL